MEKNFLLKNETYELIGVCMEVQRTLGYGFSEVIYKDAMEMEFIDNKLLHCREDELSVMYKGKKLPHKFFADFICYDQVIIEVKSCDKGITDDHIAQTLNYLRVSGYPVGLIINFGKRRLEYKRLISTAEI
ncbi:MAG: GxxExxY protein [Chitinophagaceae bacterium]